jgi:carbon-monoxide dehydrogenase medium subunit
MKPAPFDYVRAKTLSEAIGHLATGGDQARIIAGGQTLMATLNMRLSSPDLLVDIGSIPGLAGIELRGDRLVIGALTTHRAIERSDLVRAHAPLLSEAAPLIAHAAIRNSGTIGGSVAFADPAAEWPACCVALDATIVIAEASGERRVPAREFFLALYETALQPAEIITAIEFPVASESDRCTFLELSRRQGDYAIVGIAAMARIAGDRLTRVALAFIGAGPIPMLARGAMAALEGQTPSPEVIAAAQAALADDLDPTGDLYTSAATRQHLARVLLARAIARLQTRGD